MVIVDVDHPDIEAFIRWKAVEEQKVASLVTGSRACSEHLTKIMKACVDDTTDGAFDPKTNAVLRRKIRAARKAHVPDNYIHRAVQFARQGYDSIEFPVFNEDWDSEAYATVAGQNSNNTVRVTDDFMRAVEADETWDLVGRRDSRVIKSVGAAALWEEIGHAAWASADPGVHFGTTINDWHTCPTQGPIRASNSCSEYLFLDDTGATLASVNLLRFRASDGRLDLDYFEHACRLWTIALEISVAMAHYPSKAIARRTHQFRTIGLGFANLGGLLMTSGISYDSDQARAICGALTAVLTGVAYATSAEMAGELGAFEGFTPNRDAMLRVIRNHQRAARGETEGYEGLSTAPVALDHETLVKTLGENGAVLSSRARAVWERAIALGERFGYRNAQASVIAPTGTIGLVMDCDTTGIEPDFALVKFKKLAGGGYFKIINRAVPAALRTLGYSDAAIADIERYALGSGSLKDAPAINHKSLSAHGFTEEKLAALDHVLPAAFDIRFVFNKWTLGASFLTDLLKVPAEKLDDAEFDLLHFLGYSKSDIEAANVHACGAMTLEGAPRLQAHHLPVFDCANPCGRIGTRFLSVESHIRMMAAAQPFISGAISKTVNMPNTATVEDCKSAYLLSWKLGLKANALYRDGSKLSQPLSAHRLVEEDEDESIEDLMPEALGRTVTERIRIVAQNATDLMHPVTARSGGRRTPIKPGIRHSAIVAGQRVLLQTRLTASGEPAEIKIDAAELGGGRNHLANDIAVAISIGLQHGVPLDAYVSSFVSRSWAERRLAKGGTTGRVSSAIVDHVFRHLGVEYLGRHDVQAEPATDQTNFA
jgi:ribonucleoside-diphosphate reductase alpha chain